MRPTQKSEYADFEIGLSRRVPPRSVDSSLMSKRTLGFEGRRDSIVSSQSLLSFSSNTSTTTAISPLEPPTPPSLSSNDHNHFCNVEHAGNVGPYAHEVDFGDCFDDAIEFHPTINEKNTTENKSPEPSWLLCQQSHFAESLSQPHTSTNINTTSAIERNIQPEFARPLDDALCVPYGGFPWQLGLSNMPTTLNGLSLPTDPPQSEGHSLPEYEWFPEGQEHTAMPTAVMRSSTMIPREAEYVATDHRYLIDVGSDDSMPPAQVLASDPYDYPMSVGASSMPATRAILGSPISVGPGDSESDRRAHPWESFVGSTEQEPVVHRTDAVSRDQKRRMILKSREKRALRERHPKARAQAGTGREASQRAACQTTSRRKPVRRAREQTKKRSRKQDSLKTEVYENNGIDVSMGRGVRKDQDGGVVKDPTVATKPKFFCEFINPDGEVCPRLFEREEHRKRHERSVHNPPGYPCCLRDAKGIECIGIFNRQDNRRAHYETHIELANQPRNRRVDPEFLYQYIKVDETEPNPPATIERLQKRVEALIREQRASAMVKR